MKLTEKIAYMKGYMEGLELDKATKESKVIAMMADVIEDMGAYIDDLQNQVDELTELCDLLDHDLGEVETDLYCDDDDDEDDDDEDDEDDDFRIGDVLPADRDDFDYDDDEGLDDELYVVTCPSCEETLTLTEEELEKGSMICPHCNEVLEFNYDEIEAEAAEEADAEGDDAADSSEPETF